MKEIKLNSEIYSIDSIKIAKEIKKIPLKIKKKDNYFYINYNEKISQAQMGEFLNEVLNQQCRNDLFNENKEISNLIVAKILFSALGKDNKE